MSYKTATDLHKAGLSTCWDIMEEAINEDGLSCIDTTELEDCLLCRNDKTGKVHFIYSTDYENTVIFNFSLLCEVGDVYKVAFVRLMADNGYKLETVETSNDYYEILVKA